MMHFERLVVVPPPRSQGPLNPPNISFKADLSTDLTPEITKHPYWSSNSTSNASVALMVKVALPPFTVVDSV